LRTRLGKVPTNSELRVEHNRDPSFPDAKSFNRVCSRQKLVGKSELLGIVIAYCAERPEHAGVVALCEAEYKPRRQRTSGRERQRGQRLCLPGSRSPR
jgi:hypothetical protein